MANFSLIKTVAKKKGISIRQLAKEAGLGETTLHHLIKVGATHTATIERIAEILDIPAGMFFDNAEWDPSRVEILEKEIENLKQILEEKERTIRLLTRVAEQSFTQRENENRSLIN